MEGFSDTEKLLVTFQLNAPVHCTSTAAIILNINELWLTLMVSASFTPTEEGGGREVCPLGCSEPKTRHTHTKNHSTATNWYV